MRIMTLQYHPMKTNSILKSILFCILCWGFIPAAFAQKTSHYHITRIDSVYSLKDSIRSEENTPLPFCIRFSQTDKQKKEIIRIHIQEKTATTWSTFIHEEYNDVISVFRKYYIPRKGEFRLIVEYKLPNGKIENYTTSIKSLKSIEIILDGKKRIVREKNL